MENTINLDEVQINLIRFGYSPMVGKSESEIKKRIESLCCAQNFNMTTTVPIKDISQVQRIFDKWCKNVYGDTLNVTAINTRTWGKLMANIHAELTEKHVRYAYLKEIEEEWQAAHAKRKADYENITVAKDLLATWYTSGLCTVVSGKFSSAQIKLPKHYPNFRYFYIKEAEFCKQNERWVGAVKDSANVVELNVE